MTRLVAGGAGLDVAAVFEQQPDHVGVALVGEEEEEEEEDEEEGDQSLEDGRAKGQWASLKRRAQGHRGTRAQGHWATGALNGVPLIQGTRGGAIWRHHRGGGDV